RTDHRTERQCWRGRNDSIIGHELEETNTDPDLNARYDGKDAEDADKCAWTFGSNQKKDPNTGASYNVTLSVPGGTSSSRNYLIQRGPDVNSKCYIDYAKKTQ